MRVREFKQGGYGDFKCGGWRGQEEEDCRGPKPGDWEHVWQWGFKEGDLETVPQWTGRKAKDWGDRRKERHRERLKGGHLGTPERTRQGSRAGDA